MQYAMWSVLLSEHWICAASNTCELAMQILAASSTLMCMNTCMQIANVKKMVVRRMHVVRENKCDNWKVLEDDDQVRRAKIKSKQRRGEIREWRWSINTKQQEEQERRDSALKQLLQQKTHLNYAFNFYLITSKCIDFQHEARCSEHLEWEKALSMGSQVCNRGISVSPVQYI